MANNRLKKSTWWVHVILIGASFVSVLPLLRILNVSFETGDKIFSTELRLLPQQFTLDNYREVFFETNFFMWLFNSLVVTSLTAIIGVCLAATASYVLSRHMFPGRKLMMVFLMATQMVPAVMLLLPLYFMLQRAQMIDTYSGVVIAYAVTTLPFSIWLLKGYFDTIPRSLEEAAMVDGLTEIGSFWKVVLPLSTPSLAIAMLFSITQAWNEYIVARVILQSPELYTWPIGVFELQGDFDTRWGMFAAASVMVTIPVTLAFLYASKWLLRGLTAGSVKG